MTIQLPPSPTQDDFEDFVSACLLGLGYFIEASITLRNSGTEVLELDVVAMPVNDPANGSILVEAKSGDSGFPDMFKVCGLKNYLGIKNAYLFRSRPTDPLRMKAQEAIEKATKVYVIDAVLPKFEPKDFPVVSIKMSEKVIADIVIPAWYGRIAKRLALRAFLDLAKTKKHKSVEKARRYRWALETSFFAKLPIERAKAVYEAFKSSPRITGQVLLDLAGGDTGKAEKYCKQIRDSKRHLAAQYVLMMEHTARLRIVKNALVALAQGETDIATITRKLKMPTRFRDGLAALQDHEHKARIPFLWQLFIEVFGGFYCLTDDSDLKLLSKATKIPSKNIVECLELYNTFFKTNNNWFYSARDELRILKMVPAMYHGTGAFLRVAVHGNDGYQAKIPGMQDLFESWHDALYETLEPKLSSGK